MPRESSIWFRKATGWYMTTVDGVQHKLSRDRKEARVVLRQLLNRRPPHPVVGNRRTLWDIADQYLTWVRDHKAENSYKTRKMYLQQFCTFVGERRRATDVAAGDVERFVLGREGWSEGTQATVATIIHACLNWAVRKNLISHHRLSRRVEVGRFTNRTRILTVDERARIMKTVRKALRRFLFALEQTGARPFSEVAALTAGMVDWENGSVTFERHKNRGKGKSRVIYLTPGLLALMKELADQHPTGPLFRTSRGKAWRASVLCWHLRNLEKKLGLPPLTTYAWRHTFITDALEKGLSAEIVAELVGNSPKTIYKYYAHLEKKKEALREAARRAVG